jgi:hypothetical protein
MTPGLMSPNCGEDLGPTSAAITPACQQSPRVTHRHVVDHETLLQAAEDT